MSKKAKILTTQVLLGLIFTITVFTSFYIMESGEMNVVLFGMILYMPYVFLLCLYNGAIISLFELLNIKNRFINYCIPVVPLLVWYIVSDNITIRYWELDAIGLGIVIALILSTNLVGYYFIGTNEHR